MRISVKNGVVKWWYKGRLVKIDEDPTSYNNPNSVWLNTELPIIEERIMSGDVTGVNYYVP